jgi:hypothetical protein
MSTKEQDGADRSKCNTAPVLHYAGPAARPPRRRRPLHPGVASLFLGAEVGLGSLLLGEPNSSLLLAVPIGVVAGLAIYFILRESRGRQRSRVVVGQLVLALCVTLVATFVTLVRGSASHYGPHGLQYWLTYNPGYYRNPRWAMRYLWVAGLGAAWFIAVAAWVKRRQSNDSRNGPPSPHAD